MPTRTIPRMSCETRTRWARFRRSCWRTARRSSTAPSSSNISTGGGRQDHPERTQGPVPIADPASAGRRHLRRGRAPALRDSLARARKTVEEVDGLSKATRSPAPFGRSRRRRRRSSATSARSRSPAPSATSTCASRAAGEPSIRGSSAGSTSSPTPRRALKRRGRGGDFSLSPHERRGRGDGGGDRPLGRTKRKGRKDGPSFCSFA